ncbi:RloB-like protein [Hathewaya proteolytica DSM 3090]|uniref:RloB-like protein n=1 Tax=Hathewaya proteolytica DSM 3090 TaxID=1121331 RepID=A0A1M6MVM5_9CLOT|nr:RloB family protein [Hathewaya proteolytica]SHJ87507.1 RloB-like protein [Hathewaya proteolytica DSM 3090]
MSKLGREGKRKARKISVRDERPETCLIITEGTETEVNYFDNMKKIINNRYRNREIQENYPIKVEGKGRSTSVLVNEAIKRKNRENFSKVWVVFDKDDNSDFDLAIKIAKENNIEVAWSNESFELWLLLHFQDLSVGIKRNQDLSNLNNHFKNNNINNGIYNKNISNIFDVMLDKVDMAITRSEKLRKHYDIQREQYASNMNPGTTVDILVKELMDYIR